MIFKRERGITLIALVVTIVVLIILASIVIATLTDDNSTIDQAGVAKENAEVLEEMNLIDISVIDAMDKDKYGELKHDALKEELEQNIKNNAKRDYSLIPNSDSEKYKVTYLDTNRSYIVYGDGRLAKADGVNDSDITNDNIVSVVWKDDDDRDGKRPESIDVNILRDEIIVKENVKLSKDNNWKVEIKDIVSDYNESAEYKVSLNTTISDYTSNINNLTITNSHTPETLPNKVANIIWNDSNDNDGKRPDSIQIALYGDGKEQETQTLSENNNWEYVFTNLYKYRDGGIEIDYTIDQKNTINGYSKVINNFTITNTHELEKVEVAINLHPQNDWNDDNNLYNTRPDEFAFKLKTLAEEEIQYEGLEKEETFYEIVSRGNVEQEGKIINENNYSISITNLPKYLNGVKIAYAVEFDEINNYVVYFEEFNENEKGYSYTMIPDLEDYTYEIAVNTDIISYNATFGTTPVIYSIIGEKNGEIVYDVLKCVNFDNAQKYNFIVEVTAPLGTNLKITQLYCGAGYTPTSDTQINQNLQLLPSAIKTNDVEYTIDFANEYNYININNTGNVTNNIIYTREKLKGSWNYIIEGE